MRNVFWTRATISCKRVKVQRESTKIQSGNLFGELTWRSLAIIFLSFRESGSCFLHPVFYDHCLLDGQAYKPTPKRQSHRRSGRSPSPTSHFLHFRSIRLIDSPFQIRVGFRIPFFFGGVGLCNGSKGTGTPSGLLDFAFPTLDTKA